MEEQIFQPAHRAPDRYRVVSDTTELPKGSAFKVRRAPIKDGQLAVFKIGGFLILGRMFGQFIVQPTRFVDCSDTNVRILGLVA